MRSENCSKCGGIKEESRLGQRYCKKCHADHMRLNRNINTKLSSEAKKKADCRAKTRIKIKNGSIVKEPCSVCGYPKSEAHHEDYNDPDLVKWLCFKCHRDLHTKRKNRAFWGIIYDEG